MVKNEMSGIMKSAFVILVIFSLIGTHYFVSADETVIDIPQEFLQMAQEASGHKIAEDNIINTLLFLEMEVSGREVVMDSYTALGDIVSAIRGRESDSLSPLNRCQLVYQVLNNDFVIRYLEKEGSLLSKSLSGKYYDCDTGSLIMLALAHELNWPLYAVRARDHLFVRWNNNGSKLNYDINDGVEISDALYIQYHRLHTESIRKGVFLKELAHRELMSQFYYMRGNFKAAQDDHEGSMQDFEMALRFDPQHSEVYINRGTVKLRCEDHQGAALDYSKGIELDPCDAWAYFNRGLARLAVFSLKMDDLSDEAFAIMRRAIAEDFREAVLLEPALYDDIPERWQSEVKKY